MPSGRRFPPYFITLTMFNFISHEVIIQQPKESIYAYRVNIKMATALCRGFFHSRDADGAGKRVQLLNHYTCRFRPSSLSRADQSGLDGLQADKCRGVTVYTTMLTAIKLHPFSAKIDIFKFALI